MQPFVFFPVCPARASATVFVPSGMEDHGRNTSCNMLETVALAKNSVNTVIFCYQNRKYGGFELPRRKEHLGIYGDFFSENLKNAKTPRICRLLPRRD